MNCRDFQELMSAYIDNELSAKERERLEGHLRECEECRQALNELRLVKAALGAFPEVEMPEGLHDRVMAIIAAETGSLRSPSPGRMGGLKDFLGRFAHRGFRQWAPVLAGAMVLVMAISIGGILWLQSRQGLGLLLGAKGDEGIEQIYKSPSAPPSVGANEYSPTDSARSPADMAGSAGIAGLKLAVSERKIVRRATLSVEVSRGKVREAAEQATGIVQVHLGYVEQSSMAQTDKTKDMTSFYMVARVPSTALDSAMEDLSKLGSVTREDTSSVDITDQYVDLDARLRNKTVQEGRLLKIIGEAKSVGELLQVEGELSRIRGDIESMQAQLNNYDKSVSMASLSFTAVEEGTSVKPPSPWRDVWRVFVDAWRNVLLVAARSVPGIITLGALAAGVFFLVRRRQRA